VYCSCVQNSKQCTAVVCRTVHTVLQLCAEQYTVYCSCVQNNCRTVHTVLQLCAEQFTVFCSCVQNNCRTVHTVLQLCAEQFTVFCSCVQNNTPLTAVTNMNSSWQQRESVRVTRSVGTAVHTYHVRRYIAFV